jgi:hypothetical protein
MDIAEEAEEFLKKNDRAEAWIEFQMLLLDNGATLGLPRDCK